MRLRACARALESMVMTFIESLSVRPENGEEPRKGGAGVAIAKAAKCIINVFGPEKIKRGGEERRGN